MVVIEPAAGHSPERSQSGALASASPTIAVVITCWNYAEYVGQAIESVLAQAETGHELIVVDDGSTDGSWDVIRSMGVRAVRIENSGQRAACLQGVDLTRAPFILFLDADDQLKPGALATIERHLDPAVAKLQFSLSRIDSHGAGAGSKLVLPDFREHDRLSQQVLRTGVYRTPPTTGNVFRRDLCGILREATYDRAVDGVILFAAPFMGDVVSLSEELGCYRIHDRNDSGLGRMPEPASIERDIQRFTDRMIHLRTLLSRLGVTGSLVQPENSYFFRERRLWLDILAGKRPSPAAIGGLLAALWRERQPFKVMAPLAAFIALAAALPLTRVRALLAHRMNGERSIATAIKALMPG